MKLFLTREKKEKRMGGMNYSSISTLVTGIGSIQLGEARTSQVEEQVKNLEELAAQVQATVQTFEQRLSSVTTPSNKKDDPNAVPRPLLVPLAEKLRSIGDSLNQSINALRELSGAIELP